MSTTMTADDMEAVRRQDPAAAAAIERWCQATLPSEVYDRRVSAITLGEGYVDVEMFDDHGELVMESFMQGGSVDAAHSVTRNDP